MVVPSSSGGVKGQIIGLGLSQASPALLSTKSWQDGALQPSHPRLAGSQDWLCFSPWSLRLADSKKGESSGRKCGEMSS